MVDTMNAEPPLTPPSGPRPKSPIVAFLTSSTGRLIVGGVVLFVVLVAAGAVTFFFLLNSAKQVPTLPPHATTGSTPTTPAAPAVSPPEAGLKETFTFRNVFAPTVHPVTKVVIASSTSKADETSGSITTSGTTGAEDTLILKSIATDNGVRFATFEWNGANYDVSAGGQVDSSPWQVISIGTDSVLMLFGDSQVTLTVGQGFTKNNNTAISK